VSAPTRAWLLVAEIGHVIICGAVMGLLLVRKDGVQVARNATICPLLTVRASANVATVAFRSVGSGTTRAFGSRLRCFVRGRQLSGRACPRKPLPARQEVHPFQPHEFLRKKKGTQRAAAVNV